MARRYDSRTTIFSPEGRLYQVEYAMEAIGNAGAAVGILAKDGVVLAAEKRITSKVRARAVRKMHHMHRMSCGGHSERPSTGCTHLALHMCPGQHNAAAVSPLASAPLLHARCMLQCASSPRLSSKRCCQPMLHLLDTLAMGALCVQASSMLLTACPVLLQLLDTSAVGVRREKMYKLDDHVACTVAGITGEPLCSSSVWHIQLQKGCAGAGITGDPLCGSLIWRSGRPHMEVPVCSSCLDSAMAAPDRWPALGVLLDALQRTPQATCSNS